MFGRDGLGEVIVDHEVPVVHRPVDEEMDVVGERVTFDEQVTVIEGGHRGDPLEVPSPPVDLRRISAVIGDGLDEFAHDVSHALRRCHNHRPPENRGSPFCGPPIASSLHTISAARSAHPSGPGVSEPVLSKREDLAFAVRSIGPAGRPYIWHDDRRDETSSPSRSGSIVQGRTDGFTQSRGDRCELLVGEPQRDLSVSDAVGDEVGCTLVEIRTERVDQRALSYSDGPSETVSATTP